MNGEGNHRGIMVANIPSSELDIEPQVIHYDKSQSTPSMEYTQRRVSFQNWILGLLLISLAAEWFLWRGLPVKKER